MTAAPRLVTALTLGISPQAAVQEVGKARQLIGLREPSLRDTMWEVHVPLVFPAGLPFPDRCPQCQQGWSTRPLAEARDPHPPYGEQGCVVTIYCPLRADAQLRAQAHRGRA